MTEISNIVFNAEVDAIGMNCPLPILRTKKALATMQSGEVLKIKAMLIIYRAVKYNLVAKILL